MPIFGLRAAALAITLLFVACSTALKSDPNLCFSNAKQDFSHALTCYRASQANLPLTYAKVGEIQLGDIQKRSYQLNSQFWSPDHLVSPGKWSHTVDIYIPSDALSEQALLVINNGTNYGLENRPAKGATDFTEETLRAIAAQTHTIVVSINNVPNQYLQYQDDATPKREDDSVAHSWKLFLDAPEKRPFIALQIPMMEAAVKAMDLAEKELKPWKIHNFIATGVSKHGWVSWHVALADTRIVALVPFVADMLNFNKVLEHTYQVYGKNWPIAFGPYYKEGIDQQRNTPNFEKFLAIQDPLRYLDSAYANRLAIPKYIVNASSDDFFVPDNARLYLDKLPGATALRAAPNSGHYGIKQYTEQALIPFVNRLQQSHPLPKLTNTLVQNGEDTQLSVEFSESPVQLIQWTALNPVARDFRHACGIHYVATPLELNKNKSVDISLKKPAAGWQAVFVEAHFKDGFVATTPVYVFPDTVYPISAPPSNAPFCKTLPGR